MDRNIESERVVSERPRRIENLITDKPEKGDVSVENSSEVPTGLYKTMVDMLNKYFIKSDLFIAINRTFGPSSVENIVDSNSLLYPQVVDTINYCIRKNSLREFYKAVAKINIHAVPDEVRKLYNIGG